MFFFFNDTATTEIYTLSLHDALPISSFRRLIVRTSSHDRCSDDGETNKCKRQTVPALTFLFGRCSAVSQDRKSTRLNSSHANISYAVFCLKKKNTLHTLSLSLAMSTI